MLAGLDLGPVEDTGQPLVKNLIDQGTLAGTGHTGHAGKYSQRKADINVLQVVLPGSFDRQEALGLSSAVRHRYGHPAAQVGSGNRVRIPHNIVGRSHGNNLSATGAGFRPNIHDIVRRQHGILIVLHHQQAVAQVPEPLQSLDQLIIISLVEADTGFIQNVGHTHQAGPDLGGQTDPLGLAAGQGCRGLGQAQVVQAYIIKKAHPAPYLPEDLLANHLLAVCQFQSFHKIIVKLLHGKAGHLINIIISYSHRQGFRL